MQYWTDEHGERHGRSDRLGYTTEGPLGEWVRFETHATTVPGNRYCSLYFYGYGTQPVWIDEIRMAPDND
ncbi:MAG: hypothetical protein J7M38_04830 [Armatimonadetes bacterium]|nr:hypothetical protein [Armatimonadota bacterium]